MKINPINSGGIMPLQRTSNEGQGNLPTNAEKPTEAAKTNQCGQSPEPLKSNLSTEDLVKLILAMEAIEKANEITSNVIQKYLGSSD